MIRLRQLWSELRVSLWFVPSLIVLAAIGLAVLAVEADTRVSDELLRSYPRLFGAGAEGSRAMLSTIAGSMMTVAGVTFSITIAALAQASAQYTPRILRNFMGDRTNQVVLGVFVGIFAYCLVVLRTIRGSNGLVFVPSIAVLLGVLLALLGVAFLVFFIHHVASSIQASNIAGAVSREAIRTIEHLFPEALGEHPGEDRDEPAPEIPAARWRPVPARHTGYIQRVDEAGLLRFACARRAVVRMEKAIGEFIIQGTPLVSVAGGEGAGGRSDEDTARAMDELYVIGGHRTADQDPSFGVQQIVDVALKALSPGINDTTTAVTCVDYLSAILARAAGRRPVSPHRFDGGELRVIAQVVTFEVLLDVAFGAIRRNAAGNTTVLARMLSAVEAVAGCASRERDRRALARHAALIAEVAQRTIAASHERALVGEQVTGLLRRLGSGAGDSPAGSG
ncbi:DUF2254 domain-containing protein [Sorangium sp. So ce233]|uniref:DUF2254 domain-containing protein n=1 Tax=Sorangium sp. So ce233 TaxID=3133290 RepID=UPI003F63C5CB